MSVADETIVPPSVASGAPISAAPRSLMVTGLFDGGEDAERAFNALTQRGYSRSDITFSVCDSISRVHFLDAIFGETELHSKAAHGARSGGILGALVCAVTASLAAIGSDLTLPGLGLVVPGPIVAALAGAGVGGVVGLLIGALIGWGIAEERSRRHEPGIKSGGILLGVDARSEQDAARIEDEWLDTATHVYRSLAVPMPRTSSTGPLAESDTPIASREPGYPPMHAG